MLPDRGQRGLLRLAEEFGHTLGKIFFRAAHEQRRGNRGTSIRSELGKAAAELICTPRMRETPEQVGIAGTSGGVVGYTQRRALMIGQEGMSVDGGGQASFHTAAEGQSLSLCPGCFQPSREMQVARLGNRKTLFSGKRPHKRRLTRLLWLGPRIKDRGGFLTGIQDLLHLIGSAPLPDRFE